MTNRTRLIISWKILDKNEKIMEENSFRLVNPFDEIVDFEWVPEFYIHKFNDRIDSQQQKSFSVNFLCKLWKSIN